jgi:hypothetical protein
MIVDLGLLTCVHTSSPVMAGHPQTWERAEAPRSLCSASVCREREREREERERERERERETERERLKLHAPLAPIPYAPPHVLSFPRGPAHTHTHTHTHVYVCVCLCVPVCVFVCVRVCVCVASNVSVAADTRRWMESLWRNPIYVPLYVCPICVPYMCAGTWRWTERLWRRRVRWQGTSHISTHTRHT